MTNKKTMPVRIRLSTDLIFVYGTLRPSIDKGMRLKNATRLTTIKVPGQLFHLGRFPGAMPDQESENDFITGELMRMRFPDQSVPSLDAFEGAPFLFRRDLIDVIWNGKPAKAWIYWFNNPTDMKLTKIPTGDWKDAEWEPF